MASSFDVAIIGAGAVGCATARRLALAGMRVVLIEKGADILSGASKANSAILHTGFDAPADSLELRCLQEGYREYREIAPRFGLPLLETGAMVVAWTSEEAARLDLFATAARANGVADVRLMAANEVSAREPALASARAALFVPGEAVIDPWSPFLAWVRSAMALGAEVLRATEVIGGQFSGGGWDLATTAGPVRATSIVNCAGLYGDRIEAMLLGRSHFEIKPRKGQFVVYDKPAARLLGTIVLPVPTERTKGIVLTPTAFGNVLVGPTAEEQEDRAVATVTAEALRDLKARAEAMLPALRDIPVNATYAGLRPASDEKGYRIRHEPVQNWITVGGIRSTGMTSALGLARHVLELLGGGSGLRDEQPIAMPMLAEDGVRDWRRPGNGGIVCHCESVTLREIEAAFAAPLPPRDLAGLKRRTRCLMGRCQGFNCLGRLAEITRGRFDTPLATDVRGSGAGTPTIAAAPATASTDAERVGALVIGGGPAGLSAATALARAGIGPVVVIERQPIAGGVPRHCGHSPFGMREFGRILSGRAYTDRLLAAATLAGVSVRTGHAVLRLTEGPAAEVATPDGPVRIEACAVVIATGVRESTRAALLVPGVRAGGVLNTGALQDLVYLRGERPFERPVIVGSELVTLSALITCRSAGIRPVAVVEPERRPRIPFPLTLFPRLAGTPLHLGADIIDVSGASRVTGVRLQRGERRWEVDCDGVLFTGQFVPEASLLRASGIALDPVTQGAAVDAAGRTGMSGVYAAGNVLRAVRTAGHCWSEGRAVARTILADVGSARSERLLAEA